MVNHYRYSRWDDSQNQAVPGLDELFDSLSEDVLRYGDLSRAIRQFLQRGFEGASGRQMHGIQELLQKVRRQRQDMLARHNLDSLQEDLRRRLDDIIRQERQTVQERLKDDQPPPGDGAPPDQALRDLRQRLARRNLEALDHLSDNPGEAVQQLREYEFLDPDAGAAFQELLRMLRQSALDSFFKDLSQRFQQMNGDDLRRMQEMMAALNQMMRDKLRGGEPDFQQFLDRYGDLLGPNPPHSLDELLQQMRRQMSHMQSLLNSLSDQQRESLLDALGSEMFDPEFQKELAELATNLDLLNPSGIRGREYSFFGEEDVSLADAMDLMRQLDQMEELERQLDRTRFGSSLQDVDPDLMKGVLGPEAANHLEELKRLAQQLRDAGYIQGDAGDIKLTPAAMRKIGQKALRDIFARLKRAAVGSHRTAEHGHGVEPSDQTKEYEFGDPLDLDLKRTLFNALRRDGGLPLRLTPPDFEIRRMEHMTRTTTVLVLDLSRSMPMRGNFVAAKKVALALSTLIRTQFPRDVLYLVGFSGFARELGRDELPHLNVGEFGRGTNIQAALRMARSLLSRHRLGQRQVVLNTDGEPTAFFEDDGRLAIEYPPGPRVLRETLTEVRRCTKDGITINTFMLEQSYHLRNFVSQLTRANRGRVLFASADQLGEYIVEDYVDKKGRRSAS
ncbi:MAG: VWA domain-containing protein [Chloroflexota bacterium]|mgnify:CR=1 FL=1